MPMGVKSCEFILLRDHAIYFIEAKTSNPKETDEDTPADKIQKYHEYIEDVVDKMKHSVSLYAGILLRRHDSGGVPEKLMSYDLSGKKIKLVLVVKNAKKEWLIPLQEKLWSTLGAFRVLWNIDGFYAINESTAREKHFVI